MMNEDLDPFSPHAQHLLGIARQHISDINEELISAFYRGLFRHAGPKDVIALLTPEQFAQTQERPLAQLHHILDPDLNREAHDREAVDIGQIYGFLDVRASWLVDSYALYLERLHQGLGPRINDPAQRMRIRSAVTMRLMSNLSAHVRGREALAHAEQQAISQISGLPHGAFTLNDRIRSALDILTELPGMVTAAFARPDSRGDIQHEIVVGKNADCHVASLINDNIAPSIHADDPRGRGPAGRAWRGSEIQQVLSIGSDPTLAIWHEYAHQLGYASVATIPLTDSTGCSYALLSLFHAWPGYFAAPQRANLLKQVRAALEAAIAQNTTPGRVLSYSTRSAYREALGRSDLVMLYQPLIDLRTDALVKVEALARLDAHDGTYISPADFLPAFGEHELRQLFALGLRRTLLDLQDLSTAGLTTSAAINLPTQAFADREYLNIAREMLQEFRIEPERITLELLETGEIDTKQARAQILPLWKALGVKLAQDDLGSGYSSLTRMEQLGVDDVKIDHNLVTTAAHAPHKALHFIYNLTHLAHDVGIRATVEGLESEGLIEAASILGADFGQGYAIARPMTARDLARWRRTPLAIEPQRPRTALGAYATMIMRDALIGLAGPRPDLLKTILAEPCGLGYYLHTQGLENTALGGAYARLRKCAPSGAGSIRYIEARRLLENLLRDYIIKQGSDTHDANPAAGAGRRPRETIARGDTPRSGRRASGRTVH